MKKTPDKLWNKTILVTGFLKNKKGKRTLYVSHPSQIKVIDNIHNNEAREIDKRKARKKSATLKWSLKK